MGLQQEAAKIAREPGFKSVEYLGKGRYKVVVEQHGKMGEPYYFPSKELKVFSVLPSRQPIHPLRCWSRSSSVERRV